MLVLVFCNTSVSNPEMLFPSEIRLVIARMWTWVRSARGFSSVAGVWPECGQSVGSQSHGRGDCDGFDFGEASIRALRSCSAQFDNNDFKLISHI